MSATETPTPTRGVPITLDRVRYIRYSLRVLRELREKFGDKLEAGLSGDNLAEVLLLGLRGDDPELTVTVLEDLIDLEHLDEVMVAVKKAMGRKATVEVNPASPPAVAERTM